MSSLEAWHAAGDVVDWRRRRIFLREGGDGDALLCIHGFPTASFDWHRIWPDLVARHRVIAPDMLGFGFSDKPRGHAYRLTEQADLHEDLCERLGVERAFVLAHDYGASVAQELLARQRDGRARVRLRAVCFLNGGVFPEMHRARWSQKLLASPLGALAGRLLNERRFSASFAEVFGPSTRPDAEAMHDLWRLVATNDGHRIGHELIAYIAERRRQRDRWVNALEQSPVPIRFVNGPEDPVSGAHMAARWRERVPQPDVVLLDGIGHYPQLEAPRAVRDAALAFFERVTAAGG